MDILKNIFKKEKPKDKLDLPFQNGQIYKMKVAKRSHVRKPYYVGIKNVGGDFIETYIPNVHSLIIKKDTYEWGYHIPRMEYVGTTETHGHLLFKQPLI